MKKQEEDFWEGDSFIESLSKEESEKKMKTFNKKHDEDMNFNCKQCNKKISSHQKDWHAELCEECFAKEYP